MVVPHAYVKRHSIITCADYVGTAANHHLPSRVPKIYGLNDLCRRRQECATIDTRPMPTRTAVEGSGPAARTADGNINLPGG